MKLRTIIAGLALFCTMLLVLAGHKILAASVIVLWALVYYLGKYRPLAIQDIPLNELNERYAMPRQPDLDATLKQMQYRSRYINLGQNHGKSKTEDGTQTEAVRYPMVHYCDNVGEGPVIVALHGIMDSVHAWEGWIREIGRHYRLVAVDLPGFGLTGPLLSGDYLIATYVEFLDCFVEALDIHRFHLVGNSLGGAVAWNYAIEHPEKIDKLILVDPVGFPQEVPEIVRFVSWPIVGQIIPVLTPRIIFSRYVRQVYGDQDKVSDEIIERFFEIALRPGSRSAVVRIFKTIVEQAGSNKLASQIPRIDELGLGGRTFLMWGQVDRWIPVAHVDFWRADVLSLARCKIYCGAGHIPHEEIPEETAADAHQFLSSS